MYDIQTFAYERIGRDPVGVKNRRLLQFLGTEWGREIDPNLWVNLWRQETRAHLFKTTFGVLQIVICDDLRFDNEAQQVVDLGGKIIRVECDEQTRRDRSPGTFNPDSHKSESGIDGRFVHSTIYNTKDLSDLRKNVQYLMKMVL